MNPALQDLVSQAIAPLGFDVFTLRQRGSRTRPVLEVRIARRDDQAVTVDDCARASRAIEEQLDSGKALGEFYTLEVSSPGIRDDAEINWKKR
jgi:ribosome maturation factor RimP